MTNCFNGEKIGFHVSSMKYNVSREGNAITIKIIIGKIVQIISIV